MKPFAWGLGKGSITDFSSLLFAFSSSHNVGLANHDSKYPLLTAHITLSFKQIETHSEKQGGKDGVS